MSRRPLTSIVITNDDGSQTLVRLINLDAHVDAGKILIDSRFEAGLVWRPVPKVELRYEWEDL